MSGIDERDREARRAQMNRWLLGYMVLIIASVALVSLIPRPQVHAHDCEWSKTTDDIVYICPAEGFALSRLLEMHADMRVESMRFAPPASYEITLVRQ